MHSLIFFNFAMMLLLFSLFDWIEKSVSRKSAKAICFKNSSDKSLIGKKKSIVLSTTFQECQ